jgi:hypothetical protein
MVSSELPQPGTEDVPESAPDPLCAPDASSPAASSPAASSPDPPLFDELPLEVLPELLPAEDPEEWPLPLAGPE